jgi:ppGpp synthetase/RelA/SpoT-type nucleotidyltranferase
MNLSQLIEDARRLLSDKEETPLTRATEEVRDFVEKSFRVGTVRKWGGIEFQKQANKKWAQVPGKGSGHPAAPAPIPAGQPKKKPVLVKHGAPKPGTPPPPPAAPKKSTPEPKERATTDKLPDDPHRYFHKTPDSKLIPVSALRTIRARPEGILHAATHMAKAYNGEGEKRKPISLKDNGDGTYTVTDGNSTTAMARQHKWKHIVATVEPADGKPAASHDEPKAKAPAHGHDAEEVSAPKDVPGLADAVKAGKLAMGKTLDDHVKIAESFLAKHAEHLESSVEKLKGVMPEGVTVKGRVKKIHSALGKLVRKPKYGTVDKLQDGTGMRVIAKDTATLEQSIEALKKTYKIVNHDDYVSAPLGGETGLGYRSFHAIIEDHDGLQKEIQLRTPNQNTHADWCHDVYKPVTPEQDAAMKTHADTIAAYARKMGDYFHEVDSGKKPPAAPPCPEPVQTYFTCL